MVSIQGVNRTLANQQVTKPRFLTAAAEVEPRPRELGDFDAYLRGAMAPSAANTVSEEELFAGIVGQRVATAFGAEAAGRYQELFDNSAAAIARPDGVFSHEEAAKTALKGLVTEGVVESETANLIYAESFQAAQLDDNTELLFDGRGGANDPTIAIADYDAALSGAQTMIEKLIAGEIQTAERSLVGDAVGAKSTIQGDPGDGEGGFLWKPVSVNQGRLAVLASSAGEGDIVEVNLRDELGNLIERGLFSSHELGRDKFNFSKRGEEYPPNVMVEILRADGSLMQYLIEDPSKRYD